MSAPESPIRFGTDGVRGRVGAWPITPAGAAAIGRGVAALAWSRSGGERPVIVMGRDTRASSAGLLQAAATAASAAGATVLDGGVLPTAAVSCAVAAVGAAAGVMVTASHNPARDNGLKVLQAGGGKLSEPADLEARFGDATTRPGGSVQSQPALLQHWVQAMPAVDLRGLRIWLDAASGAGWAATPPVLEARGATVLRRDPHPDGANINAGTGAMHPPTPAAVRAAGCHLAICLDGDADRVVLVDPQAGRLDGDDILWLCARDSTGPVVGTVMTNGGLDAAFGERLVRARVGDRHVAAGMREHGAQVGAETSGHVLFSDGLPTGDGTYAALRVLAAVAPIPGGRPGLPLPVGGWERWPAATRTVQVCGPRRALDSLQAPGLAERAGNRVVVRYSGTEPVVRVLVEGTGTGEQSAERWADRIAGELSG